MGFLVDIFWAVCMVGVPVAAFTLVIVWWSLEKGYLSELIDTKALGLEIKAMSGKRKGKTRKEKKQAVKNLHPVQRKWAKFGGGFYGIVGFFTYLVIEFLEIIGMIRNMGGFFEFIKQFGFDVIVQLLISALTNFISALVWPLYWLQRIDAYQPWVWFVVAYGGYWVGLKLAQALVQYRARTAE